MRTGRLFIAARRRKAIRTSCFHRCLRAAADAAMSAAYGIGVGSSVDNTLLAQFLAFKAVVCCLPIKRSLSGIASSCCCVGGCHACLGEVRRQDTVNVALDAATTWEVCMASDDSFQLHGGLRGASTSTQPSQVLVGSRQQRSRLHDANAAGVVDRNDNHHLC